MATEVLLVQGLVLMATAAFWWIARRDLAARVSPPVPSAPPADTAELEQLCATLESLVTNLSQRLEAVEARLPKPKAPMAMPVKTPAVTEPVAPPFEVPLVPVATPPAVVPEPQKDTRYTPVYALLESGLSDPVEIARQTGLGRGEVDLILSLRERRVL